MGDVLPTSLVTALDALQRSLDSAGIPMVVVGGVAASLLGRPRLTRDIDALVDLPDERWVELLAAAHRLGIEPRIDAPLEFAARSRVLLLRHVPSQIDIDVILGALPFEREAVAAGRTHSLGPIEVRLPRIEDLMIMKALAQRPRDLIDLEALLDTHPEADLETVRRWVREFATAATLPELLATFDTLVARSTAGR